MSGFGLLRSERRLARERARKRSVIANGSRPTEKAGCSLGGTERRFLKLFQELDDGHRPSAAWAAAEQITPTRILRSSAAIGRGGTGNPRLKVNSWCRHTRNSEVLLNMLYTNSSTTSFPVKQSSLLQKVRNSGRGIEDATQLIVAARMAAVGGEIPTIDKSIIDRYVSQSAWPRIEAVLKFYSVEAV
jgi:hypothetical protein